MPLPWRRHSRHVSPNFETVAKPLCPENAELVIALGNYFSRRGEVLAFARHIVDAITNDDRLRASDSLARLFPAFALVPGICTGIKRTISTDLRIDQDCSHALIEELLDYVRLKAEVGIDSQARARRCGCSPSSSRRANEAR